MIYSGNFRKAVPANSVNVVVLPEDLNRVGLIIFNAGANSAFVAFGTDSQTGIEVPTRQYLPQFPQGATPTQEIRASGSSGGDTELHIATTRSGSLRTIT